VAYLDGAEMTLFDRAKSLLDPGKPFGQPATMIGEGPEVTPPERPQMVLRMMVRSPSSDGLQIPPELEWLRKTIEYCNGIQTVNNVHNPYVYVTVRSGPVVSRTDDLWHVDGFSMRVPHPPEQNYIWCNCFGTEVLNQEIRLPSDFDPMRHNIHRYFQAQADERNTEVLNPGTLYAIDPYVIHRRPSLSTEVWRTFFRISFVPIEIEDDTYTINPLIPRLKPYGREDIRLRLEDYS